jgi:Tfp pilus assembly protein PilF
MYWRQGEVQAARELFEEALKLNPNHNYALTYYAKLLVEVGEYSRARGLRERLDALQGSTPPVENDIEVEIEDL